LGLAAVNVNEVKNEEQFMNVTPAITITNQHKHFFTWPKKKFAL
jgi:hypothetical protein